MPSTPPPPTTPDYHQVVSEHLRAVDAANRDALDAAADLLLAAIRADGLIVTGGAGHSLAAVADTFYRAGGLACVRPLYHPALLPLHGATAGSAAERTPGLAADVLAADPIGAADVLVVFSTSGVNPYPVELAGAGVAAHRPVVAVTSLAACAAAPRRSAGTVADSATVVLDTLVPPGDAAHPEHRPVTAPLSSLTNAFLWNALLVRLVDQAASTGTVLPLWRSANTVGGDEANAGLLARFGPRISALR